MADGRCSVRLTRRYAASLDEVWDALLAGRWLGTDAIAIRVVEPRRVVELALPASVARIELHVDGETTVLVLDHEDVAAPAGMRAMGRWTAALARLEQGL
jgi:hypothetical protein